MLKFVCKRLIISIFILIGISIILFALFEIQPGNPYFNFVKPGMSPKQIENMLIEKGFYDPVSARFSKMFFSFLCFDFGYSLQYGIPVNMLILKKLPNTLFLTIPSLFFAVIISILLGRYAAYYPKTKKSKAIDFFSSLGICTPTFFIAIFLIKLLAFDFPIFPISGLEDISKTGAALFLSRIQHAALPILTLTLIQTAPLVRYVRGFMSSIKNEDFIRSYEGFGFLKYTAYKKEGFKAILPRLSTMIFMEVPYLISGALITESIFVWHGVGKLNFDAANFRDYPVILGITSITAVCVLLSNLAADILNYYFDKRMGL